MLRVDRGLAVVALVVAAVFAVGLLGHGAVGDGREARAGTAYGVIAVLAGGVAVYLRNCLGGFGSVRKSCYGCYGH